MLLSAGRRLASLVPVLVLVSLATFMLLEFVPGDPAVAVLGPDADPARLDRVRTQLGLDRPLPLRYLDWLGDVVRGDLGRSIVRPTDSVASLIASRLPVTIEITLLAMLLALVISVPTALLAAARPGSGFDRAVAGSTSAMVSIPPFVAGLLLVQLFVFNPDVPRWTFLGCCLVVAGRLATQRRVSDAPVHGRDRRGVVPAIGAAALAGVGVALFARWPDLPRQGFDRLTGAAGPLENLRTAFLPALTVALTEAAVFTRLLREDIASSLEEEYVLSAKAKGLPPRHILLRHALRPSLFSLVTLAGVSIGRLLGGTVIVESIFNLPGMGRLVIQEGVLAKDFPIVQGGVLVLAVLAVVVNSVVDVSYSAIDPRMRSGRA